jgi:hypothetical protein
MKKNDLKALKRAVWFCLSLAIASIGASLGISLVVVVRLAVGCATTLHEMPWQTLGVLSPLTLLLFREAERNRKWFILIWDRVTEDSRERQALRLVESIEDGCIRDWTREHMALSLISTRSVTRMRSKPAKPVL